MSTKISKTLNISSMKFNTVHIIDIKMLNTFPDELTATPSSDYTLKPKIIRFFRMSEPDDLVCCYKINNHDDIIYIFLNLTGWRHLLIIKEQFNNKQHKKLYTGGGKDVDNRHQFHSTLFENFLLYYDKANDKYFCTGSSADYTYKELLNDFFHTLNSFLMIDPHKNPEVSSFIQNNIFDVYNLKRNDILSSFSKGYTSVNNLTFINTYRGIEEVYMDPDNRHCFFLGNGGRKDICLDDSLRLSINNKYYIDFLSHSGCILIDDDMFNSFIDTFFEAKSNITKTNYYYDCGLLIKTIGNKIKISFLADQIEEREKNTCTFYKSNIITDDHHQLTFKKLTKKADRLKDARYKKAINDYLKSII